MCCYDKILVNVAADVIVYGALVRSKHKHKNNLPLEFKVHLEYVYHICLLDPR